MNAAAAPPAGFPSQQAYQSWNDHFWLELHLQVLIGGRVRESLTTSAAYRVVRVTPLRR